MQEITKKSLQVFSITAITYILSILFTILFAHTFGTSSEADAYTIAMTIPNILYGISNALFFTPLIYYASKQHNNPEQQKKHYTNALATALLLFVPPTILVLLTHNTIMNYFTTSHANLLLITALTIPLYAITSVFNAILHTHKYFILANIFRPATLITAGIALILFKTSTIVALGFVIGLAITLLLQIKTIKQHLTKPTLTPTLFLNYSTPLLVGSVVYYLARNIPLYLSSNIGEGAIAIISYTTTIFFTVPIIVTEPLSTVLYPYLTQIAHQREDITKHLKHSIRTILLITIPLTILLFFYSEPIITTIYQHGKFTINDAKQAAHVLSILALAFIPLALHTLFYTTFLALGKPWHATLFIGMLTYFITFFAVTETVTLSHLAETIAISYWLILSAEAITLKCSIS